VFLSWDEAFFFLVTVGVTRARDARTSCLQAFVLLPLVLALRCALAFVFVDDDDDDDDDDGDAKRGDVSFTRISITGEL
jgi:hypothetical protein